MFKGIKCPTCQLSKFGKEQICRCQTSRRQLNTKGLEIHPNKFKSVPLLNSYEAQYRIKNYRLNKQYNQQMQKKQDQLPNQYGPELLQKQKPEKSLPVQEKLLAPEKTPPPPPILDNQQTVLRETILSQIENRQNNIREEYCQPLIPPKPPVLSAPIIPNNSVYSGVGTISNPPLLQSDQLVSTDLSTPERKNRELQYQPNCPCQDCQMVRIEKLGQLNLLQSNLLQPSVSQPKKTRRYLSQQKMDEVRDTIRNLTESLRKYPDLLSPERLNQLTVSTEKLIDSFKSYQQTENDSSLGIDNNIRDKPQLPLVAKQCPNPTCDHLTEGVEITVPVYEQIDTIEQLISIAQSYHCQRNKSYHGINLQQMYYLIEPLQELQQMVGLEKCKAKIVDHIIFFLKQYQIDSSAKKEMLHTVIYGPPGTGKTTFARILGKIYANLGLLSKGHFTEVSRTDLIVGYLGQSTSKTSETINNCLGGIMFIDEAYNLGHKEKRDSIAKECIDTLTQRLSEERDLLCIIAGYREEIDECFFDHNKGLKRRFPFIYEIEGYTTNELMQIFQQKMCQNGWSITPETIKQCETQFNSTIFRYYGGDIESFVFQTKLLHARTNFSNQTQTISQKTLEKSLKLFELEQKNRETETDRKKREDKENQKRYEHLMYS